MWVRTPRERLCEEVLGSHKPTIFLIPAHYDDITADFLFAAMEAVYSYSPEHVRQMLPFVLSALEKNRSDLIDTGYFDTFFLHVNYDFRLPLQVGVFDAPRYSRKYCQGWIAPTLSAMNRFERGWAFEWVRSVMQNDEIMFRFGDDITMVSRILAMALDKPESESPTFES